MKQGKLFPKSRSKPTFDGETFEPTLDRDRLLSLFARVEAFMHRTEGKWWTLGEIANAVKAGSEASVSARLRDMRKDKFGQQNIQRRRRGDARDGLFEYTWCSDAF